MFPNTLSIIWSVLFFLCIIQLLIPVPVDCLNYQPVLRNHLCFKLKRAYNTLTK